MSAHWMPVVGWEGFYEISDQGQVRSLDRVSRCGSGTRINRGRILRPDTQKHGHMYVILYADGKKKKKAYLHRMVLEAFVSPAPDGMEVRHYDGNPSNNTLANLRWGTRHEQRIDDIRNGVHPQARKTHCPRGHELVAPNLIPSTFKSGGRSCLACSRAQANARAVGASIDTQNADDHYARIMGVAA